MLIAVFIILLGINIIGFMNRKRAWSKIFMVSQVLVVGGLVVMFNVFNTQTGIQGLEAKKEKKIELPASKEDLQKLAKDQNNLSDTIDVERNNQSENQVKGF